MKILLKALAGAHVLVVAFVVISSQIFFKTNADTAPSDWIALIVIFAVGVFLPAAALSALAYGAATLWSRRSTATRRSAPYVGVTVGAAAMTLLSLLSGGGAVFTSLAIVDGVLTVAILRVLGASPSAGRAATVQKGER